MRCQGTIKYLLIFSIFLCLILCGNGCQNVSDGRFSVPPPYDKRVAVEGFASASDGSVVVCVGSELVWVTPKSDVKEKLLLPFQDVARIITSTIDSTLIAVASYEGEIGIVDPISKEVLWGWKVHLEDEVHISNIIFCSNDTLVITSSDGNLTIWDCRSAAAERLKYKEQQGYYQHTQIDLLHDSPDFNAADIVKGKLLVGRKFNKPVDAVTAFPDGKKLIVIVDGKALILNTSDLSLRYEHVVPIDFPRCVAVSPDGRQYAVSGGPTGLTGNCLRALDEKDKVYFAVVGVAAQPDFKELYRLEGHTDVVHKVQYHPSGKWIVSSASDETICLWDIAAKRSVWQITGMFGHTWAEFAFCCGGKGVVYGFWTHELFIRGIP